MNATITCPDRERLSGLLLGLLPADEVAALEMHLGGCSHCLCTVQQLQAQDDFVEAVHEGLRAGPLETPPPDDPLIARLCRLVASSGGSTAGDTVVDPAPEALAIPGYDVLERLGAGGMGVVYKARQVGLDRLVAVKVIRGPAGAEGEQRARFQTEAQAAARLRHPNIVQIHEVGDCAGRPYLALEYLEGGNLAQHLAGTPRPGRWAAELVATLARAVEAAHQQGILHRDLKPANVLLTADGTPKVADFGLAKWLTSPPGGTATSPAHHTQSGALLGTPSYMAPEQATGHASAVGPVTDVYALGAILYEALTGRPPFQAATILETLEYVRTQEPVPPRRLQPGVPRDLQTICLKCLQKEPGRRYPSALELAEDLDRCLRNEPIRARPVGRLEQALKWARRRPAVAVLLATSGLALLGLLVGGLVYSTLLRAAVRRAEDNATETRQQERLAAANYRIARDTLSRMLARLEGKRLAEVPRLKELRQQQLEDALAFYQEVVKGQDHPDPAVRSDTAAAYEQAATIQNLLGRPQEAEANFQKAIALLEGLPDEVRDQSDEQARLVHCHHHLGYLARNAGRPDDEQRHYLQALAICERMAAAHPGEPQWQNHLARANHNLGEMNQTSGRSAEAEAHYTGAIAVRAALVRDHAGVELYRSELAGTYSNLGLVQANGGRQREAAANYAKAEELLAPLVRAHPEAWEYSLPLAGTCTNWGNTLKDTGRPLEALPQLDRAIELTEAMLRTEPRSTRYYALNAHGARAQVYEQLGRHADAVKDWDRVVELNTGPDRWTHQLFLGVALARAGEHARAAAEAQALEGDPKVTPEGVYALARLYALSVGPAHSDAKLSATAQTDLAERYAARAVALLQKLQEQGYFKGAEGALTLGTEPEFSALRGRPGFQQLLKQVWSGKK